MDSMYKVSGYLQMIFCLMMVGIFVIYHDSEIECDESQGSYFGVVVTVLVFLSILSVIIFQSVAMQEPLLSLPWSGCLITCICFFVFIVYLPIHFFSVNGCREVTKLYLWVVLMLFWVIPIPSFCILLTKEMIHNALKEEYDRVTGKTDKNIEEALIPK